MPGIPNLGDVRAIDWTAVEPVDVVTAGFPCQDISAAGRRAGIENGARSGLWTDIVAGIRLLRPALLIVENVAALRWKHGGLHRVLGDLADAGYDAAWRSVRAADIGAAHRRERVFLCAWPHPDTADGDGGDAADADRARRFLQRHLGRQQTGRSFTGGPSSAAAHTDRDQPERRREPRSPAGSARPSPGTPDQRQRPDQVRLLPTPRATDGTKGCPAQRGSKGDLMLPSAVMRLLTTDSSAQDGDGIS
jgi:DNA (cytosine-5)-methyltransferase 1